MFLNFGRSSIPRSELGPAREPLPPALFAPRTSERELIRDTSIAQPTGDAPSPGLSPRAASFLTDFANLVGSAVNAVGRAAIIALTGPAAPILARALPGFRIIPTIRIPPSTPITPAAPEVEPILDPVQVDTTYQREIAQATELLGYDPRTQRELF